jgi:DNA-binding transcriptional LysR family regulator|tara:strand:+ start:354 stop:1289 length:936 start_codon:yes stop_codon:yes gene_type:complete
MKLNTLPFTLQQLRILKAIASKKNFTNAASSLYISQPSLSKQIKILEENLNTVLINRERNNISLTESGRVFLQYSNRILILCEESCRALIDLKKGDRGNLKVGASQTIGTYLMPRILASFAQNYPQIDLKVQVNSTRTIANSIIKRKIDVAIVGGDISKNLKKKLTIQPFVNDELSLIVSNSHPFATKRIIKKEDLYCLDFITLHSTSTIKKFIDNILIQNKIQTNALRTILQLNSIEGIKTAVSLGLGAAFVSSSSIEKEMRLKQIRILKIENLNINRQLSVISNPDCSKSKAFQLFYNELIRLQTKSRE